MGDTPRVRKTLQRRDPGAAEHVQPTRTGRLRSKSPPGVDLT
jgi:hypothetical protein